jgi:hypothetical protein
VTVVMTRSISLRAVVGGMFIAFGITGCAQTYPYLIVTDDCNCTHYRYLDRSSKVEYVLSGDYAVNARVASTIRITLRNLSKDTLSLKQGHIRGSSRNIRYENNGRYVPLPFVDILPGEEFQITLAGTDTETVAEPWFKIAGERVRLEIKGLLLKGKILNPMVVEFIPVNPKLSS